MRTKFVIKNIITQVFYSIALVLLAFYSRKVFLTELGVEYVGMLAVLTTFITYLNISELGVASALSVKLYKPISEKDYDSVNNIVGVLKSMYRYIGVFIMIVSVLVGWYLSEYLIEGIEDKRLIYFTFYAFLFNSVLSYFVNYRLIIFSAMQQEYKLVRVNDSIRIATTLLQIFVILKFDNVYYFLYLVIASAIVNSIVINIAINKNYPFLIPKDQGRNASIYKEIIKFVKRVFLHKIKDVVTIQSLTMFIFLYSNLSTVAIYATYDMLAQRITMLLSRVHNSFIPSVGNLVAEATIYNVLRVYWILSISKYCLALFVSTLFYFYSNPFIETWLGSDFLIDESIVSILSISIYFSQIRGVVDVFNHAYGNYKDSKAVILEIFICISLMILGGVWCELEGVLIGNLIGIYSFSFIWRPYYLFSKGFKINFAIHVKSFIKTNVLMIIIFILVISITENKIIDVKVLGYFNLMQSIFELSLAMFIIFILNLFVFYRDEWYGIREYVRVKIKR